MTSWLEIILPVRNPGDRLAETTARPVVSVTENPTLGKLEAVGVGDHALQLISHQ